MRPHKSAPQVRLRYAGLLLIAWSAACDSGACSPGDPPLERVVQIDDKGPGSVKRHIGYLKNGKKHGWWAHYWGEELRQLDHWKDGVQHGPERVWYTGDYGYMGDTHWVNGKMHGRSRWFSLEDTRLTSISWWWHNKPDMFSCDWTDDGRLERIVEYHRGYLQEIQDPPTMPCPYVHGDFGRHHLDPDNTSYVVPNIAPSGNIPLPQPILD